MNKRKKKTRTENGLVRSYYFELVVHLPCPGRYEYKFILYDRKQDESGRWSYDQTTPHCSDGKGGRYNFIEVTQDNNNTLIGENLEEKTDEVYHFVDTHCNLPNIMKAMQKEDWNSLYKDIIEKDENILLDAVISVASDTETRAGTLQLINTVPNIYAGFGIHPLYAYEYNPKTESELIQAMENPKTIAWGEIDYHEFGPKYSYAKPELQKSVFISQMQHAISQKKPIIIHTREAEEDTFNLMKEYIPKDWKIDVHCYTDTLDFALKLLKEWENLYLGFSGAITFKSAHPLRQVVQSVPLEKLLLETDGPFLAPEPFRGKTSHPGYIPLIASKIAEIKSLPLSTIYETTRENSRVLFGI